MTTCSLSGVQVFINSDEGKKKKSNDFTVSIGPHFEKDFIHPLNDSGTVKTLNEAIHLHGESTGDLSEMEPNLATEVDSEANAESLSSSDDSEEDAEKKVPEIRYFRFTRKGLCIFFSLNEFRSQTLDSNHSPDIPSSLNDLSCTVPNRDGEEKIDETPYLQNNYLQDEAKKEEKIASDRHHHDNNHQKTVDEHLEEEMKEEENDHDAEEEDEEEDEENLSGCPIIDFEMLCRKKYPASYSIGFLVDRFSRFDGSSLNRPTSMPSSNLLRTVNPTPAVEASSASEDANLNLSSTEPLSTGVVGQNPSVTPKVSCHTETEGVGTSTSCSTRSSVPTFHREDRLSSVIKDILYRLNRHGTLANPRDVCKKGGGKSGEYYDLDDEFFDDSSTYEILGLSATDNSTYDHSNTLTVNDNFSLDDLNSDGKAAESYESPEDDYYRHLYNYKNSTMFQFDNSPENDHVCLLNDYPDDACEDTKDTEKLSCSDDSSLENELDSVQSEGASLDMTTGERKKKQRKKTYTSTKYWIRRKAWRDFESKLSPHLISVLSDLESSLFKKGTRKGLFVQPADVAVLCRDVVRDVFCQEYPNVAWDSAPLVASMYPEALTACENKKEEVDLKASEMTETTSCVLTEAPMPTPTNSSKEESSSKDNPLDLVCQDTINPTTLSCSNHFSKEAIVLPSEKNFSTEQLVKNQPLEATPSSTSTENAFSIPLLPDEPVEIIPDAGCSEEHLNTLKTQSCVATVKKPFRKKNIVRPCFQNTVTTDNIVSIRITPTLKQLGVCLMKMTNVVTPDLLKKWSILRLVLYNQVVYSALEHRLYKYIMHKSSLFRTRGSFFFRNLKKAVDSYLKSIALSNTSQSRLPFHDRYPSSVFNGTKTPTTITPTLQNQPLGKSMKNKLSKPLETSSDQICAEENMSPKPSPDSPFTPVAKELLNWAIIYNCRKHELKVLGETLDEWAGSFSAYAVDILNQSIQKRLTTGPTTSATSSTTSLSTAAPQKSRLRVPIKFLEETLNQFKEYYGIATLYERRGGKCTLPQFIIPCKGLQSPLFRSFKKQGLQTSSKPNINKTLSNHARKNQENISNLVQPRQSSHTLGTAAKMKMKDDLVQGNDKETTQNDSQRSLVKKRWRSDSDSLNTVSKPHDQSDQPGAASECQLNHSKKTKSSSLSEKKIKSGANEEHIINPPSVHRDTGQTKVTQSGKIQPIEFYFVESPVLGESCENAMKNGETAASMKTVSKEACDPFFEFPLLEQSPEKLVVEPLEHTHQETPKLSRISATPSSICEQSIESEKKISPNQSTSSSCCTFVHEKKTEMTQRMGTGSKKTHERQASSPIPYETLVYEKKKSSLGTPSCDSLAESNSSTANMFQNTSSSHHTNYSSPVSHNTRHQKSFFGNSPTLAPYFQLNGTHYDHLTLLNLSFNNPVLYNLPSSSLSPPLSFLTQYLLSFPPFCPNESFGMPSSINYPSTPLDLSARHTNSTHHLSSHAPSIPSTSQCWPSPTVACEKSQITPSSARIQPDTEPDKL